MRTVIEKIVIVTKMKIGIERKLMIETTKILIEEIQMNQKIFEEKICES